MLQIAKALLCCCCVAYGESKLFVINTILIFISVVEQFLTIST